MHPVVGVILVAAHVVITMLVAAAEDGIKCDDESVVGGCVCGEEPVAAAVGGGIV